MPLQPETTEPDPARLRRSFGQFATGVCVIGTTGPDGRRHGATVNSFTSVSLDPALVLVCLGHSMRSHDALAAAPGFGVSVLSAGQEAEARHFAGKSDEKWPEGGFRRGRQGGLLLPDCLTWFDCTTESVIAQGDHTILVGRIHDHHAAEGDPLLYFRGGFERLPPQSSRIARRQSA